MSDLLYLILGGIALLLVVGVVVARLRRQRALPSEEEAPRLKDARREAPSVTPERATLDRPVEDTEGLSLRELRAVRAARLTDEYKSSDAAKAQREYRMGEQEAPLPHPAETKHSPLIEERIDPILDEISDEKVEDEEVVVKPPVVDTPPKAAPIEPPDRKESKAPAPTEVAPAEPEAASLEGGLARTRDAGFIGRLSSIFKGKETLDADLVESIEEVLFTADIGASTSQYLLDVIEASIAKGEVSIDDVWALLRDETEKILSSVDKKLEIGEQRPFVILVVGVNGVGKTTTIGKLAAQYQREGKKVLMIAGDTFRAAAVQQLEEWANRVGCGIHKGEENADPSGVIYGGIEKAKEEGYDVVLADTAGRLHTRAPLIDELKKIVRACDKATDGAPHETVLVLDANTGQNAIQQARMFHAAVNVDGLVLSKLDGTAKGGIILGITREMSLPVYYIGIGEGIRDLRPFDPVEFVDALF